MRSDFRTGEVRPGASTRCACPQHFRARNCTSHFRANHGTARVPSFALGESVSDVPSEPSDIGMSRPRRADSHETDRRTPDRTAMGHRSPAPSPMSRDAVSAVPSLSDIGHSRADIGTSPPRDADSHVNSHRTPIGQPWDTARPSLESQSHRPRHPAKTSDIRRCATSNHPQAAHRGPGTGRE